MQSFRRVAGLLHGACADVLHNLRPGPPIPVPTPRVKGTAICTQQSEKPRLTGVCLPVDRLQEPRVLLGRPRAALL